MKIGLRFGVAISLFLFLASGASAQCVPDESVLCLGGGRFQVTADWRTAAGETGAGRAVRLGQDTGYFWFFRDSNVEMVIKVLDACNGFGHFWVFAGGLTDVGVDYTVTDLWTGNVRRYGSAPGKPFQPLQDTTAFATCGAAAPGRAHAAVEAPPARSLFLAGDPASGCLSAPAALCLQRGRFQVQALWRTSGAQGTAHAVQLTEDTGYFWFFDDSNLEMVVKVLDACDGFGRFWVFAGGLTNVGVEMTVTDTVTGEVRTYANEQGTTFEPIQDAGAFQTCDAPAPPQIRFVGDSSVALSGVGAVADLTVEVLDAHGRPIPDANVEWRSSNPAAVALAPHGLSARLTAQVAAAQTVRVTASYQGLSAGGTAFVVHFAPGAHWLPAASILSRSAGIVVLAASPDSERIQAGDVVVSGDAFGLLDRVVARTLTPGRVVLELTPAALTDAYDALAADWSGLEPDAAALQAPAGGKLAATPALECRAEPGGSLGEVRPPEIGVSLSLSPKVRFEIDASGVKVLHLGAAGELGLTAQSGSAVFAPGLQYAYRCERRLPQIPAALVPVAPGAFLTLDFVPKIVVEVRGGVSASQSFVLAGPKGSSAGHVEAGIQWERGGGWTSAGQGDWTGTLSPGEVVFQPNVGIDAAVAAKAAVGLEAGLKIGRIGPGALSIAGIEFANLEGGAAFRARLPSAPGPESLSYVGPSWTIDGSIDGSLGAELTGAAFRSLLRSLGIDAEVEVALSLFHRSATFAKSPTPAVSFTPPSPGAGDTVTFTATAAGTGKGSVEFLGSRNGTAPLERLAQAAFSDGRGDATWRMIESARYRVVARLRSDPLSELLPYSSQPPVELGCQEDGDLNGAWELVASLENPVFAPPGPTLRYVVSLRLEVPPGARPGAPVPIGGTASMIAIRCASPAVDGTLAGGHLDMTFCPTRAADGYYGDGLFHAWSDQASGCGPIHGRWGIISDVAGPPEDDLGSFVMTRRSTAASSAAQGALSSRR